MAEKKREVEDGWDIFDKALADNAPTIGAVLGGAAMYRGGRSMAKGVGKDQ